MRRTRPGTPAAMLQAGTLAIITLPAPITAPSPISTPSRNRQPKPIRQRSPIRIGPLVQRVCSRAVISPPRSGTALGLEHAAGDLAAAAQHDRGADVDAALGVNDAVHADIAVGPDPDRADLGLDRHAAAEDRAVADLDAGRAGTTPVDHAGVVDDDMVAQRDPLAVADDQIAAEDHAATAAAEQATGRTACAEPGRARPTDRPNSMVIIS